MGSLRHSLSHGALATNILESAATPLTQDASGALTSRSAEGRCSAWAHHVGACLHTAAIVGGFSLLVAMFPLVTSALNMRYPDVKAGAWSVMAIGYGGGLLLLCVYFAWEEGPFHWDRTAEAAYLSLVLAIMVSTAYVLTEKGSMQSEVTLPMEMLFFSVISLYLFDRVDRLQMHPKFYDGLSDRAATAAWVPPATPRSKRALEMLERGLNDALELKSYRNLCTPSDETFPWVLFVLRLVEVGMWATKDCLITKVGFVAARVLNVLVFLGFLESLWRRARGRGIVRDLGLLVERLVTSGDKRDLQHVLARCSVATLVELAEWGAVRQLAETALVGNRLSTLSKAVLIDAFQKSGLRSRRRQRAVLRLLLSCHGAEMTTLKNLIDGSGSYHNLHKLVYQDISNKGIREGIIFHMAKEGSSLREQLGQRAGIKVLSDVDDTLYSSGGKFPAGCDRRFPKNVVYPGLLKLFQVLGQKRSIEMPSCDLVFLTARPHIYKDVSEDQSYRLLKTLFEGEIRHKVPTLLPGSLRRGLGALATFTCRRTRAWRSVGDLKFASYSTFRALYPEYDFVFCGDNGQGDLWAGQRMIEANSGLEENDPRMLAVLIQQVLPDTDALAVEAPSERGPAWRSCLEERGLFLHGSYVGAAIALQAHRPELLSVEELVAVAEAAIKDFDSTRLMYLELGDFWAEAEQSLRSDLDRANAVLQARGLEPLRRLVSMDELLHTADLD